jgi:hypothetical protein
VIKRAVIASHSVAKQSPRLPADCFSALELTDVYKIPGEEIMNKPANPIATGRTAEIYAHGEGKLLELFFNQ